MIMQRNPFQNNGHFLQGMIPKKVTGGNATLNYSAKIAVDFESV